MLPTVRERKSLTWTLAFAALTAALLLPACGRHGANQNDLARHARLITRADYSTAWPFTVQQGILSCKPRSGAITLEVGTVVYGLNAAAVRAGHDPPTAIWTMDTHDAALKDLSPVIRDGRALCR
jgi:hypothetical protein